MDYLRNGIKELPLNPQLLYNFACANERIERYEIAIKFFQFAEKCKARWPDALFGQAICHFKLHDFKASKKCTKIAIKAYKNDSMIPQEVMLYFQAMCYKNLRKFDKASRDYLGFKVLYDKTEKDAILQHVIQVILLPLDPNRRNQDIMMHNTLSLVDHFTRTPKLDKK